MTALSTAARRVVAFERTTFILHRADGFAIAGVYGRCTNGPSAGDAVRITGALLRELETGWAVRTDTGASEETDTEWTWPSWGIRSFVWIPIRVGGRINAIVGFESLRPNAFGPEAVPALEAVVRECAGTLNTLLALKREREASQRLGDLDELKNDFVGMVAHDLRTPITVLTGFTDLLLRRADKLTVEQKQEFLETMWSTLQGAAILIDDIVEVAHIESGTMRCETEPLDLAELSERSSTASWSRIPAARSRPPSPATVWRPRSPIPSGSGRCSATSSPTRSSTRGAR